MTDSNLPNTSIRLLDRWQTGEQSAADDLFDRYTLRLIGLARSRLSSELARRTDPEDVVFSAWRSFFVAARDGRFVLHRSGDLWRLLAAITLNKLRRQVRYHTAERRSVHAEARHADDPTVQLTNRRSEPTPDEVIAVSDLLESLLADVAPFAREIIEARLRGEQITEIAAGIDRSERTVRRVLAEFRRRLHAQMESE